MLEVMDWFCGAGGSSQGIAAVPHVRVARAANHWAKEQLTALSQALLGRQRLAAVVI